MVQILFIWFKVVGFICKGLTNIKTLRFLYWISVCLHVCIFLDKSIHFSWANFPQRLQFVWFHYFPRAFIKANFLLYTFLLSCNFGFCVPNKSVVILLKMCQLYLEECWTFVSCSKTQVTAELLLVVKSLEEKPNCMKIFKDKILF